MSTRHARAALEPVLDHVRAEPSRTWTIIISFYGDAIMPRGGSVWLGTLLTFCERLGIAKGVVRTAMSRLAADGWLERQRVGRNSFYALAPRGREAARVASERIYAATAPAWSGAFDLVMTASDGDRDRDRRELSVAGYEALATDMWIAARPRVTAAARPGRLSLQLTGSPQALRTLAAQVWPLARVGAAYERFLTAFGPLHQAVRTGRPFDDLDALVARVLLVHEYRRVVLRDPGLPDAVLPDGWPGTAARALCAAVYHRLLPASERWLDTHAKTAAGRLPSAVGLTGRFRV